MSALRRVLLSAVLPIFFLSPACVFAQRISAVISGFQVLTSLAINTAANRVYVLDEGTRSLSVIDGTTNHVIGTAGVGRGALTFAFNPAANKIYVVNGRDNTVTVINANTLATTTVNVGIGPAAVAVNSVTNRVYVANSDDNTVTVIDGGSNNIIATVPVDEGPLAVAVNPLTNKIYVGNQRFVGGSSITVIDGSSHHTTTVALPFGAYFQTGSESLLVDAGLNQIYAPGHGYDLFAMDGSTNTVSQYGWAQQGCPERMALNTATHHVYAPDTCSDLINDFDGTTGVMSYLRPGFFSFDYASVDSVRNKVYAADPYSYWFSEIDAQTGAATLIQVPVGELVTNSVTNTTYMINDMGEVVVIAGGSSMQFSAVQPCRVLDTRTAGGPIQGKFTTNISVLSSNCNIPATAAAYSLNLTLVPVDGDPVGYLTAWPTDQYQPTVSTMNSLDGRVKANAAIISAGTLGNISVFPSDTTNLVVDIDGYFEPPTGQTLAYYPITPCRVIDTRGGGGNLGGPYLSGGHTRNFPVTESSCIPADANAQAYSFNFTVVPHGGPMSYLTVWPQGQPKPITSTLNNFTATTVANAAIVPAGAQGGISVYPSDNTDLVVDISGYFAPPATGGLSLYATTPCRVLDTRSIGGPFEGEQPVRMDSCAPSAARAYVLNATVIPRGSLGYLALWPDGQQQPVASTLNASDGWITSNMAIVPSGDQGYIDAYASGLTDLVLDVSGYFAP